MKGFRRRRALAAAWIGALAGLYAAVAWPGWLPAAPVAAKLAGTYKIDGWQDLE